MSTDTRGTDKPTVEGRFHHLHLNATAPEQAAIWYRNAFGGELANFGPLTLNTWPNATNSQGFRWFPAANAKVEGSVGSTLDHFGWSVAHPQQVDELHERLVEEGAHSDTEPFVVPGSELRISFLIDPFGTRIELLNDPKTTGWHHVHLLVPDPEADRRWWQRHFGGTLETFNGLLPGLRQPGPTVDGGAADWWILFRQSERPLGASAGRSIDHFAYWVERADDVDRAVEDLAGSGVEVLDGPRDLGPLRVGFVAGPGGVKVEILSQHGTEADR